jgi:L-asparaginase II
MMAHPELVGGERRRFDTALMRAAPGAVVAKGGAEGVQGVGVLAGKAQAVDGGGALGLALKIEDGDFARRAGSSATCLALGQLGVLEGAASAQLADYASPPIHDPRGDPSGEVRAILALS